MAQLPAHGGSSRWRSIRRRTVRLRIALPGALVILLCLIALFPGLVAGFFGHGDPRVCELAQSRAGSSEGHPFGFDVQGCDLYANVVWGTRASVSIGLLATAVTVAIAIVLGAAAGYLGGFVDSIISRVMDVFFGFPFLVGMIVVLQVISVRNVVTISLVLALFSWPGLTRVMRASTLEVVNLDYVTAARSIGSSPVRILTRHVGINAIGPVVVVTGLNVGAIITAEAALTFLGVGLQAPSISWGVQLATAQRYFTTNPHLLVYPALFLSVAVLSFVLLGDALRDTIDPRLR